ncbi:MAG: FlgO family outer membrane protein [Myxococcota bacterium]
MRPVALLFTLLATQAAAAPPSLRIVAPGLRVTNLKASLGHDFNEHLAQQLVARGIAVVTAADIQAVISLERQKQLLGCADDASSCMSELAGALGADGVLTGTVVRIGKKFQVNVRIVDARDARPIALFSEQADREEDLFGVLDLAAQKLVNDLTPLIAARAKEAKDAKEKPRPEPVQVDAAPVETRPGARRLWWVPAAATGVFAVTAVVFFTQAAAVSKELTTLQGAPADYPLASTLARGRTFEALGWTGAGLATAALLTTGALLLFAPETVTVSVAPRADGAALVVGGAW